VRAKSAGFIAYYRVSTDRQGRSGLGLEAQRAAVVRYLAGIGGILLAEHTVAEHELEMISARTKAALQAAKARGVRLGRNAENLAPANHAAALDHANQIKGVLAELAGSGMSARQIAAELSARGIPTARGGRWHPQNVIRAMQRVAS
jgi:DNA invertase Pin-like site-specific DNA recombinase